ncbi:hypothetical protein Gotri_018901 [Gossypium trilobum]|uniref:Malectin-like domain-containing protein n=1 Tax=Gossypium trilobum TaxID=34281 RepID=A0A7J9EBH5_9ROSI|nr:hypothetical protein [Gossypium trilobum]
MEKLQNLIILLQLLLLLPLSSAYAPPNKYFINCGSNSNVSGNGQNFVGDLNSGVSFFVGQSSPVIMQILPHLNSINPQESIDALHFTSLNSISSPVIKEFLVTINEKRFRICFIPSQRSNLAFVNAIEVFLTLEDFIPDTASLLTPAGSRISFDGLSSQIPDDSFLFNPMVARNSDFFSNSPKYRGEATEFTAPDPVYSTAKEMNIDESSQLNFFNVTWSFNVSKSSSHFVRVHFCDIISVSLNVIIFGIYIYNKFSAMINPYDMGLLAVPFYYDFVVDSDESGIKNISIVPRLDSPNQIAFLNGLEIMELIKKSDFVSWPRKPESNRTSLFAIFGSIGGGSFVIILVAIVLLSLKRRNTKRG